MFRLFLPTKTLACFSTQFIKSAILIPRSLARLKSTKVQQNLYEYFRTLSIEDFDKEISQQRPSELRFIPYENLFAHCVLKKLFSYDEPLNALPDEINKILMKAADNVELISPDGDGIGKLTGLDAHQVIKSLQTLTHLVPYYRNEAEWRRTFYESTLAKVWRSLDQVSTNVLKTIKITDSMEDMITISRLWFEFGLIRDVTFNQTLIDKLVTLKRPLTKLELLHLMFSVNLQRTIFPHHLDLIIEKLDTFLADSTIKLNIDELSIIAMGFFKTKTKMPLPLLHKYLARFKGEILATGLSNTVETMSVVSCLKLIRFSFETTTFDAREIRLEVKEITTAISTNEHLLQSNICLTHLILLLNSSFLHGEKRLYKLIFDRMILQLDAFRIKDIERILFCLSNAYFTCPPAKMEIIEKHLLNSEESTIYPYHIYNIVLFMTTINFYPNRLIELCCDPEFMERAIELSKLDLSMTLVTLDTIFKLELERQLLTEEKVVQLRSNFTRLFKVGHSKKARFIKAINDSIADSHYGPRYGMFYLFPFSSYPFPVILSEAMSEKFNSIDPKKSDQTSNSPAKLFPHCHAYKADYLQPGYFDGCKVVLLLMNRDFIYTNAIRGVTQLHKRLLQALGFKVIQLQQRELRNVTIPEYAHVKQKFAQQEVIHQIKAGGWR